MPQNDTQPTAPSLPNENERRTTAPETAPQGDNSMPAAARLVIEEFTVSNSLAPASRPQRSLSQLASDWEVLNRHAVAAWKQLEAAEAAASEITPPHPIRQGERGQEPRPNASVEPNNRDRLREAAINRWEAQQAAIATAFNVPSLERDADKAQRAANELADLIMTVRPTTAIEAAAKFRIVRIRFEDGHGGFDLPERIHDFQADLDHLAKNSDLQ